MGAHAGDYGTWDHLYTLAGRIKDLVIDAATNRYQISSARRRSRPKALRVGYAASVRPTQLPQTVFSATRTPGWLDPEDTSEQLVIVGGLGSRHA